MTSAEPPREGDQVSRSDRRRHSLEVAAAVVLAVATLGSTWCSYQAARWGGVQTFQLEEANKALRLATEHTIEALQFKAFDASVFVKYIEARDRGDQKLADLLLQRCRPEMRKALEAWLRTDPFPKAPPGPFQMKEYVEEDLHEANRRQTEAHRLLAAAHTASDTSDSYVLLTVLFASVLFFAGIGGTIQSVRLRVALLAIATAQLQITIVAAVRLPVY